MKFTSNDTCSSMSALIQWRLALVGAILSACVACADDQSAEPEDRDASTASHADMTSTALDHGGSEDPDMGVPDVAPSMDAGRDMSLADAAVEQDMDQGDAGVTQPLRQLVEHGMWGDLPLHNRVKDPMFSSINIDYIWIPLESSTSLASTYRNVTTEAPLPGVPMLVIPEARQGRRKNISLYGEIMLQRLPHEVSVWIGTGFSLDGSSDELRAYVYGMDTTLPTPSRSIVTLLPDNSSTRVINGISWRRFEAVVAGFMGYGYLAFEDSSASATYIQAPVAVPVTDAGPSALVSVPWSMPRPPPSMSATALNVPRVTPVARASVSSHEPSSDRCLTHSRQCLNTGPRPAR